MAAPVLDFTEVLALANTYYGVSGSVSSLGSCQDANFRIKTAQGESFVMKFSSSSSTRLEIEFQNAVIFYLHSCSECSHIDLPLPQKSLNGQFIVEITINNIVYLCRLLHFVEGNMLCDYSYFAPDVLYSFGSFIATVSKCLINFSAEGSDRDIQWDLRRADKVIDQYMPCIRDSNQTKELTSISKECLSLIQPYISSLRVQVVHGDLANYNVIAKTNERGRPYISGIIDFGDAMESYIVGDLAVAILSCFSTNITNTNVLTEACMIVEGFHKTYPLQYHEVITIWPFIILRSIINILSIEYELIENDPNNEYNIEGLRNEYYMNKRIMEIPMHLAIEAMCMTCGFNYTPNISTTNENNDLICRLLTNDHKNITLTQIDVDDITSELYNNGAWLHPDKLQSNITALIRETNLHYYYIKYGIPLLHLTQLNSIYEPCNVNLGIQLFLPMHCAIYAPCDCEVIYDSNKHSVILRCEIYDIYIHNVVSSLTSSSTHVHKGDSVCHVTTSSDTSSESFLPSHAMIQVCSVKNLHEGPMQCCHSMFAYWQNIFVDPFMVVPPETDMSALANDAVHPDIVIDTVRSAVIEKRHHYVASIQQYYYPKNPPQIERGYQQYLYDTKGRCYLDLVNNVALVGHCHAAINRNITKQMNLLNTNSRFIYSAMSNYAEKIISHIKYEHKDKLNVVFFVNSGSEATDLALRISRTVITDRRRKNNTLTNPNTTCRDVICFVGGYHGCTTASDEISTTLNDNPRALESRPPWIHLVPMPNLYKYENVNNLSEESIAQVYVEHVRNKIKDLNEKGTPPACFICEPLSGNAGGVMIPKGYLKEVYTEIRKCGGLCIADEVQVGYGRLGNVFWGYEEHDVIPDIITMAKAAGNGHPLGFVITSKEIANEFGNDGSFFSSAGGGPISCVIGHTVLEIIENEALQKNAYEVGEYMHQKLQEIQRKYPHVIGYIHGHGFYQGIEIIKDQITKEPGTELAYAICERLLTLGIITHNTGDYSNVLKVKPPLLLNKENVDHFVLALDICMQGW
jgi:4-aminobutyrate aminotransferase-like enzyme/Ser/Thr protein kinase RdoA (MazF antagonist)